MISGFNTDVEFDGVVYHVQTEDKGVATPKIITLVYDRGTILASKRSPYDDLLTGILDEKVLAERVQKQHNLICAAVKAGRINDLKQMTAKAVTRQTVAPVPAGNVAVPAFVPASPSEPIPPIAEAYESSATRPEQMFSPADVSIAEVRAAEEFGVSLDDLFADAPLFEDVSIVEEAEIVPDDAIVAVSEMSGTERPTNHKLSIELLGETRFKGGDRLSVNIMVCRGTDRKVVGDAQIMIKVLGSSFRPVIFHSKSDSNGLSKVHLQLPRFQAGRAALLIRAMSAGEEVELRRVVVPG